MHIAPPQWSRTSSREEAVVSAYQAKTHLSGLLDRASRGETITITKHGHPIARLVPIDDGGPSAAEAIARIHELRERSNPLGPGLTIRELIDDGKRYL